MAGFANRFITALIILAMGVMVIWLSLPRLFSSLYVSNYGDILEELSYGREVSAPRLALAAKGHALALSWMTDGGLWTRLGEIRLAQAKVAGFDTPEGKKFLELGIEAQKAGLAMRPLQPYAWNQLALTSIIKNGVGPELEPLLRMSVKSAPFEPKLVLSNVDIGLLAWPRLSEEGRELVSGQIVRAALYYPDRLARVAKRRYGLPVVRKALANRPDLAKKFLEKYLRL